MGAAPIAVGRVESHGVAGGLAARKAVSSSMDRARLPDLTTLSAPQRLRKGGQGMSTGLPQASRPNWAPL